MTFFQAMPWHEGEEEMHRKLRVPEQDNPTVPMLSPQAASMLKRAPLLAIGTTDSEDRPWTTVWGGKPGFSQPLGNSIIGIRTPVSSRSDPVVETLVGTDPSGEVTRDQGAGRMVGGLSIDLATRKRVKIYGRMVAGALSVRSLGVFEAIPADESGAQGQAEIQLVVRVEQSLGNCPKYLNIKEINSGLTSPKILSDSTVLCPEAVSLLSKADLFFMSTSHSKHDMDTNHRGGPPGFVRILSNSSGSTTLVYPEYSGNRLYQSLGNLMTNPQAGICIPNFENGDCLYMTGEAEILTGRGAADILPRCNLAVKYTITAARFVSSVLPFRGTPGEFSPYNPAIRYLKSEKPSTLSTDQQPSNTARLLEQTPLSPTVSKFRFALSNPATYTAGQYVTFDFFEHLGTGYSHMRDDDPHSLNDDFVRTFTVSSPPGLPPHPSKRLADDEFEITMRKVGVVTDFLFKHGKVGSRRGTELEVDVKGFGGSFEVRQDDTTPEVGFLAAGVGITPLLPCVSKLDLSKLKLLWALRREDVGLATDVLKQFPSLGRGSTLFLTGDSVSREQEQRQIEELTAAGLKIEERRMLQADFNFQLLSINRWYICTGTSQRQTLLQWLEGKEVVYEDFNF